MTARRGKYNAKRTNGYASKKEAKRAQELKMLERSGRIRNLREQVKFIIVPKQKGERECSYVADFVYEEYVQPSVWHVQPSVWRPVVEDCKGYRTPVYVIKRKLMLHVHGIRVRET